MPLNTARNIKIISLITTIIFCITQTAIAKEYRVSSVEDIHSTMRHANPGDTLIMRSGDWHNAKINITGHGTKKQPIILKSDSPGSVTLTGQSFLSVNGSHITVSGLLFKNGYLPHGHVVRLQGKHHRFTNSAIVEYNPPEINTRFFWVSLFGQGHRVDNNHFSGQNHSGVTTVVWLKGESPGHHLINANYYGQRPRGNANGFETIRIGAGKNSNVNAHVIVEGNLFDEVDGEIEIISNKSNDNIYRFNTFLKSAGTLTLRQGKRCLVSGNFFIGKNKKGTGGIRIVGESHKINNNYIEGTSGRAGGAISITAGTAKENKDTLTLYPQVNDVEIAFNTVVNNTGPALILDAGFGSKKRHLFAKNINISNNIFHNTTSDSPLIKGPLNDSIQWSSNIVFGSILGYESMEGLRTVDPEFNISDGLLRPENNTVTQTELLIKHSKLNIDIDGQARAKPYNIGADQQSNDAIIYRPLTQKDVGPSWVVNTSSTISVE